MPLGFSLYSSKRAHLPLSASAIAIVNSAFALPRPVSRQHFSKHFCEALALIRIAGSEALRYRIQVSRGMELEAELSASRTRLISDCADLGLNVTFSLFTYFSFPQH